MDESEHNYIVRNIQAAHRSQIEHILQQLNRGSIDGAKNTCQMLLDIYNKRNEVKNG